MTQAKAPAPAAPSGEPAGQPVELLVVDASNSVHVHAVAGPAANTDPGDEKGARGPATAASKAAAGYSEIRQIAASMGVEANATDPATDPAANPETKSETKSKSND
jgi:hypothetical protein